MNEPVGQNLTDIREMRRRKRERILIIITVIVIVFLTFAGNQFFQKQADWGTANNIFFVGLLNINIILILFLIFLMPF